MNILETAGTALKTIVARFSEVKELYSAGELLGEDSEGEAIDVNKVSTALRTAGINLNEYFTGMKGLDDILLELAQKWDTLEITQQRYIATMAAGSRQQSRFIAMMSDYNRTMELVGAAYDADGAAQEQYGKTLESLETKLTKLKNAWNEFTMGLANSEIVKQAIDLVTQLLTKLNDITGDSSIGKLGVILGGLFGGRALAKSVGNGIASMFVDVFGTKELQKKTSNSLINLLISKGTTGTLKERFGGLGKGLADALLEGYKRNSKDALINAGIDNLIKDGTGLGNLKSYITLMKGGNDAAAAFTTSMGTATASLGLYILAIGAAIAAIVALIRHHNKFDPSKQYKRMQETAANASSAAKDASESVETLGETYDSLGEKYTNLDNLTKGTKEWNEAVKETNQSVLDLAQNYQGLQVTMDSNGILHIDEDSYKKVMQNAVDEANRKNRAAIFAQKSASDLSVEAFYDDNKSKKNFGVIKTTNNGIAEDKEATYRIAEAINNYEINTVEQFEDWIQKEDVLVSGLWDKKEGSKKYDSNLQASFDAFNEFAEVIRKNTENQENYNEQIKYAIISQADLNDQERTYATNLVSGGYIQSKVDQYLEESGGKVEGNFSVQKNKYAQAMGYENARAFQKATGFMPTKEAVATWQAEEKVTNELIKSIKDLSDKFGNSGEFIQKVFGAAEGEKLTKEDLLSLKQGTYSDENWLKALASGNFDIAKSPEIESMFRSIYGDEVEIGGEEWQAFIEQITDSAYIAAQKFVDAEEILTRHNLELGDNIDLNSDQTKKLTDKLVQVFQRSGSAGFNKINDQLNDIYEGLDADQAERFTNALVSLDWTEVNSIDELSELLPDLGLTEDQINDLEESLIKCGKASKTIDTQAILDVLNAAGSLSKKAKDAAEKGEQLSLTDKEYESVLSTGAVSAEDFYYDIEEEKYLYLGDKIDEVIEKLSEQIGLRQQEGETSLQRKVNSGEAVNSLKNFNVNKEDASSLTAFLAMYTARAGKNSLIDAESIRDADLKELQSLYDQVIADFDGLEENSAKLLTLQTQTEYGKLQLNSMEQNAALAPENDQAYQVLQIQASKTGMTSDQVAAFGQNSAEQLATAAQLFEDAQRDGYKLEDLNKWVEIVENNINRLSDDAKTYANENKDLSYKLADDLLRLNENLNSVITSYDTWHAILAKGQEDETYKSTVEYQESIQELGESLKKAYGLSDEFDVSVLESAEALELLDAVALGGENAVNDLAIYLANADLGVNVDVTGAEDSIDTFSTEVSDWIENAHPTIGMSMDNQAAIDALNELVTKTGMSMEDIRKYVESIGFEPVFGHATIPHTVRSIEIVDGEAVLTSKPSIVSSEIQVPYLRGLRYTGATGGAGFSPLSGTNHEAQKKNLDGLKKGASSSSSPKSSSSKEDKTKTWTNTYDKLYNLQEQINEALRSREKLERDYDRILRDRKKTADELIRQSLDEIANLRYQRDLQQQMLAGRKKQLKNIGKHKYTTEDGETKTLEEMGVTKYASYDTKTGLIQIDWEGINKVKDYDTGKAIEEYIKLLEERAEQIEEATDSIDEITDEIYEVEQRGRDSYLELEQRVYDALVQKEQEKIDALESVYDMLEETNQDILEGIREQVDLERQIRDNTKTEEDIAEKERRLAYLKRDTSGANQLEIKQLEQELAEQRESYSDTLVDQNLDAIDKSNQVAADQRARQIELLQKQLDMDTANGKFWEETKELIARAFDKNGNLKNNSALVTLLQETEEFAALSEFGSKQWITDLTEAYKAAMEGLNNYELEDAKAKKSVTLSNGAQVKWNKKTQQWEGVSSGKVYENVHWNAAEEAFVSDTKADKADKTAKDEPKKDESKKDEPKKEQTPADRLAEAKKKGSLTLKTGQKLSYVDGHWVDSTGRLYKDVKYSATDKGFVGTKTSTYYDKTKQRKYTTYTIKKGDTLWALAEKNYGSGAKYTQIMADNPKLDPNNLQVGQSIKLYKYAKGGLVNQTGPAWLDGTKTRPEVVLNANDTENFIALRDILRDLITNNNGTSEQTHGDNYFNIQIDAEVKNDYDVDKMAARIKRQILNDSNYRNVQAISRKK